jgi:hypothetical protein
MKKASEIIPQVFARIKLKHEIQKAIKRKTALLHELDTVDQYLEQFGIGDNSLDIPCEKD